MAEYHGIGSEDDPIRIDSPVNGNDPYIWFLIAF